MSAVVSHSVSTSNHNIRAAQGQNAGVVSHSVSTSNHNRKSASRLFSAVVSHSVSTSNHNSVGNEMPQNTVVSHSVSTSNHNASQILYSLLRLYLIPFLHQTTTTLSSILSIKSCISFRFYIKPQLCYPTTWINPCCISFRFYIKPQLRA